MPSARARIGFSFLWSSSEHLSWSTLMPAVTRITFGVLRVSVVSFWGTR
jgi:hypothetical protein